jgi:glycosyltransferase involved in cell wall biosynthesis
VNERPSILYAVPGHDLLPSAGPTRNVLSLAEALSEYADVTVAFRRVADPVEGRPYRVVEIEPSAVHVSGPGGPDRQGASGALRRDDAALRGASLGELYGYLRALRKFVTSTAPSVDIVLEKSWLVSGYLTDRYRRAGTPAAVVENIVRVWKQDGGLGRRARHEVARSLVGRWLRRAPLVIAETTELRRALTSSLGVAEERIEVIGLGIDRERFAPRDRAEARTTLGLNSDARLLLYVGVLDTTHDLTPVLRALNTVGPQATELHVVGDGAERDAFEALARAGNTRVVFHGRVPHDQVPTYIAACDLALAPYDRASFPGGEVGYSTLKIPESLACGRPVASVASGHIKDLIEDGVTGFLLQGDEVSWTEFMRTLPDRARLDEMGRAAAASPAPGWDDVAQAVLAACKPLLEGTPPR